MQVASLATTDFCEGCVRDWDVLAGCVALDGVGARQKAARFARLYSLSQSLATLLWVSTDNGRAERVFARATHLCSA